MTAKTWRDEVATMECDHCGEGFGESDSLSEGDRCPECEDGDIVEVTEDVRPEVLRYDAPQRTPRPVGASDGGEAPLVPVDEPTNGEGSARVVSPRQGKRCRAAPPGHELATTDDRRCLRARDHAGDHWATDANGVTWRWRDESPPCVGGA